jgi:hypothetical protein
MLDLKNKIGFAVALIGLICIFFIQRSCSAQTSTEKQKVVIPEKKGEFKDPVAILHPKSKKDSIIWKDKIVRTENPFNKKLAEDFIKSQKDNDSLKALNLYLKAIQEVDGTYVFDNKDVKLEITTKTRGEILKITPKYTIKEREETVVVKNKETVFALYAGGGVSDNLQFNNFAAEVHLGIQNKSGDIITAGYDTQKNISIKYSTQLFKIKK